MQCKNHPELPAIDRCTGCAEPFCSNCLVEIHGQKYCGSCKIMALKGQPAIFEEPTIPCKEANEALIYSIVGLFCCAIILEPIALSKAAQAKRLIDADPRLQGAGKVTAARIIAVIGLILWGLTMMLRFANLGKTGRSSNDF